MMRVSLTQKIAAISLVSLSLAGGFVGDALQTASAQAGQNPSSAWQTVQTTFARRAARLVSLGPVSAARFPLPSFSLARNENDGQSAPEACADVLSAVETDFYAAPTVESKPNQTRLTYAAVDGMLATIHDPYTVFFTPAQYKDIVEENEGNFVGIGTRIDVNADRQVVVVEAIDGSPAQKAGVLPGDVFLAVNTKSVVGQSVSAVTDLIRGTENSRVRVTFARNNKPITFNLKRSVVHSPVVHSRMEDGQAKIGYIALSQFNEQADTLFDAALAKLEKQELRALVFDLRDNPGGLLDVAQDVASRFIDSGAVVWVKEKNGQISSLDVDTKKHRSPLHKGAYPVVVLVNGGSASASEIVAGAIQDAGVGKLLGTTTYGKGLVQTIIPLADDSAVKITTQHYFTRDKHDINKKRDASGKQISGGVIPDMVVPFDDKAEDAQRAVERRDPQNWQAIDRADPQLQNALAVLSDELAGK